jgi:hypothetical protein
MAIALCRSMCRHRIAHERHVQLTIAYYASTLSRLALPPPSLTDRESYAAQSAIERSPFTGGGRLPPKCAFLVALKTNAANFSEYNFVT